MAISVSERILEAWGFEAVSPSRSLTAVFHSLHVYQVQGLTMGEPHIGPISGVVADGRYKLCVGNGVNAMCLELTQDQYSDSEEKWRAEHSSSPPYLMILLGPTKKQIGRASCRERV